MKVFRANVDISVECGRVDCHFTRSHRVGQQDLNIQAESKPFALVLSCCIIRGLQELMSRIMEETGAVLYVKGQHVEPALKHRTQLAPGVKYLHVEIIAPTPIQVQRARCVSKIVTKPGGFRVLIRHAGERLCYPKAAFCSRTASGNGRMSATLAEPNSAFPEHVSSHVMTFAASVVDMLAGMRSMSWSSPLHSSRLI